MKPISRAARMICGQWAGATEDMHDEVGTCRDGVGDDGEEVGDRGFVGVARDDLEPERLDDLGGLIALQQAVGVIAGDEGDLLHPALVAEDFVHDRRDLVARDHAEDRVLGRRRVERAVEGVRDVDRLVLLDDRTDRGRGRVHVRADDVADAFLAGQPFGAGDRELRIVAVVDRDDLDPVEFAVDLDAALGVVHLGGGEAGELVDEAPRGLRAAHNAELADLEDLALGTDACGRPDRGRQRERARSPKQRAAVRRHHLSLSLCVSLFRMQNAMLRMA